MLLFNCFCFLAALAASQSVNLLLPGFQGRSLEASVEDENLGVTTYIVACPKTISASDCGIPGGGITVISAPSIAELKHINNLNTASLSCQLIGKTYASCHARQTISVQATLAPKDLNWMNIPVVSTSEEVIFAPPSLPTFTASKITTDTSSVSEATAIQETNTENIGTSISAIPRALYHISTSMVLASMGSILVFACLGWQNPPFPIL